MNMLWNKIYYLRMKIPVKSKKKKFLNKETYASFFICFKEYFFKSDQDLSNRKCVSFISLSL